MLEIVVKTENQQRHVRVSAEELAGLVRRIGDDGDKFLVLQRIPDLPDVYALRADPGFAQAQDLQPGEDGPPAPKKPGRNPFSLDRLSTNLYNRPQFLGQFWVGLPAWPALLQATLVHLGQRPILDGFMAAPMLDPSMNEAVRGVMEKVVNHAFSLHQKYGGLKEVGDIYTTIAGLLNILAIYDAYEGPADRVEGRPPTEAGRKAEATTTSVAQALGG